jgi:MerR family transcriptional regulator, heat shock protein HspR
MIVVSTNAAMEPKDKDTPLFTIATVARLLGVSVGTLRQYDRKGLILVHKTEGNQRLYSESDVERLRCIRTAITEHKISIEGIRHMHSMIPCWQLIQCPMEQRVACPAYYSPEAGCWTYKHQENACEGKDCRDCRVYQLSCDCNTIKQLVYQTTAFSPVIVPQSDKGIHT